MNKVGEDGLTVVVVVVGGWVERLGGVSTGADLTLSIREFCFESGKQSIKCRTVNYMQREDCTQRMSAYRWISADVLFGAERSVCI